MTRFMAGFLTCYLVGASAWGALLYRVQFSAPKVMFGAALWPVSIADVVMRARVERQ